MELCFRLVDVGRGENLVDLGLYCLVFVDERAAVIISSLLLSCSALPRLLSKLSEVSRPFNRQCRFLTLLGSISAFPKRIYKSQLTWNGHFLTRHLLYIVIDHVVLTVGLLKSNRFTTR
jgi:hypothetical protein